MFNGLKDFQNSAKLPERTFDAGLICAKKYEKIQKNTKKGSFSEISTNGCKYLFGRDI
jgi:hypothetical protein